MTIRVLCFAAVREIVGKRELVMEVPDGITAEELFRRLAEAHVGLGEVVPSLRAAVNREYAAATQVLRNGDEVALIPPVSGGAEDLYEITESPLSADALIRAVTRNTSGAIASFTGVVREFARGRQVVRLEYDAYPEMALAKMRDIGAEIRARWPVDGVAIAHRIGRLGIGEASVIIAVSAPHRREALEACAYAIERLKSLVPIWKKEVWADGSEWIGSTVEEYHAKRA
jgi:molybdopterin synthase catalytic subunit